MLLRFWRWVTLEARCLFEPLLVAPLDFPLQPEMQSWPVAKAGPAPLVSVLGTLRPESPVLVLDFITLRA